MKRILFALLLALTTVHVFSQESAPLTFKRIPMGGPVDEFISEMEKRGFERVYTEDQSLLDDLSPIMYGDFAGFSRCWLCILSMHGKVCSATINFPKYKNWESLQIIYEGLQKSLINKYGEPTEVVENFQTDRQPETDSMRMAALHADKCRYFTSFNFGRQSITLSIDNFKFKGDSTFKNYISLRYMTLIPLQIKDIPKTDSIPTTEDNSQND